jgi:tetratricopeptide (TPR) repeat protein
MLTGKSTPGATLRAARKPGEVCMAHFYIGEWHLLRGQKIEAATALQRAADMCPKEYFNLDAARAELKRLGAGRDAAERAKSGPEHGTANQLQARVDTQPSSPFLNRTIDPGVRVEFERFLEMLDQVLRVNPKNASALAHRCFVRAIFGQLQQATPDCDEAVRLQPNNAHIRDARGLTHLLLGRYDNAIADYDVATRLEPRKVESLFGRSLAKRQTGDNAGSAADLAAAKAINPSIAEQFAHYGLK